MGSALDFIALDKLAIGDSQGKSRSNIKYGKSRYSATKVIDYDTHELIDRRLLEKISSFT